MSIIEGGGPGGPWEPVHLDDIIAGILAGTLTRPEPTVGILTDGRALFYRGRVNGLHGDAGTGKSYVAMHVAVQQLERGEHVVYLDYEDDAVGVVSRLLALGATPNHVRARFHYFQAERSFQDGGEGVLRLVEGVNPPLVVIDSTGVSAGREGLSQNDDSDIVRWFATLPKPIAARGPAVLNLDHGTKAGDKWDYPAGSHRKLDEVSGAQYYLDPLTPFSRDRAGASILRCAKDRSGNWHKGQKAAQVNITPDGEQVRITLTPLADTRAEGWLPTVLMGRVSEFLEHCTEPVSARAIREGVKGKHTALLDAVRALVASGHVEQREGARGPVYRSIKAYTQGEPVNES